MGYLKMLGTYMYIYLFPIFPMSNIQCISYLIDRFQNNHRHITQIRTLWARHHVEKISCYQVAFIIATAWGRQPEDATKMNWGPSQ